MLGGYIKTIILLHRYTFIRVVTKMDGFKSLRRQTVMSVPTRVQPPPLQTNQERYTHPYSWQMTVTHQEMLKFLLPVR